VCTADSLYFCNIRPPACQQTADRVSIYTLNCIKKTRHFRVLMCFQRAISESNVMGYLQWAGLSPNFIIIIIIICHTFMLCIYNYTPETTRVSRVYTVAAVLYLQFVLHVMLFRMLNMFCTFTLALSAVSVLCPIWLLSSFP
jgi:hypothetical protein